MTSPLDATTQSTAPRRKPQRLRSRYAIALAVLGIGVAGAAAAGTGASPANGAASKSGPKFKVHAVTFGTRTSDFRVGEPLVMTYRGKKIGRICWSPAPIELPQCSNAIAAPAVAGRQKIQLTFDDGTTAYETLSIGAAGTELPVDPYSYGAVPGAHPLVMEATCTLQAYGSMKGSKLSHKLDGIQLSKGQRAAAYYRSGPHAIAAWGYTNRKTVFYSDTCLKSVR